MSTQFHFASTGEWAGVRWAGCKTVGKYAFDFGKNHSRATYVVEAARNGERFTDENGSQYSGDEFLDEVLIPAGRWTYGEFGRVLSVADERF